MSAETVTELPSPAELAAAVDLGTDDDFVHIVATFEHYRAKVARRAPYALCGTNLEDTCPDDEHCCHDTPGPECPDCARIAHRGRRV